MKENTFVWADLSSYQPEKTKLFYENVFGWKYYEQDGYYSGYKNAKEIVGLYRTPTKFQKMNMPSFWMSYIQVENVLETVEKAKYLGGIIELVDAENSFGRIALIRDTQGAGFTIYDGNQLNSRTESEVNTLIFNELHVSNADKAIAFYENLFNWDIVEVGRNSFDVMSVNSNLKIASIYQINNAIKSKYEYWVCTFGIKDLKTVVQKIKENKGSVIFDEENKVLCSDGSEAFFYVKEL
jgi:predicted enzyme related to lactoylglutathione lyase